MKQRPLIEPKRCCEVCGCQGSFNKPRLDQKEPVILSINLTIYRRTRTPMPSKEKIATSKRLRVCEPCLVRIGASQGPLTVDGEIFALGIIARAKDCYSGLCDREKKWIGRNLTPRRRGRPSSKERQ